MLRCPKETQNDLIPELYGCIAHERVGTVPHLAYLRLYDLILLDLTRGDTPERSSDLLSNIRNFDFSVAK